MARYTGLAALLREGTLFERAKISREQANMLLAIEEGYFVDLKAVDIKPAKLTQFVSAFANASGGEIYIGIDELDRETEKTRRWRGFADPEAANGHIQPLEQMRPLGGHYRASFLECDGLAGLVLKLEIPKSRDVIC